MSFGFECKNNNDITIIDSTLKNYQVYSSGTASLIDGEVLLTIPDNCLVLISPHTFDSVWYFAELLDRNHIFIFGFIPGSSTIGINRTISYVLLIPRPNVPTKGYGFNVYNASGELTFTSTDKTPGFLNVNAKTNNESLHQFVGVPLPGKRLYVDVSPFGFYSAFSYAIDIGQYETFTKYNCFRVTSGIVQCQVQEKFTGVLSYDAFASSIGGTSYVLLAEY